VLRCCRLVAPAMSYLLPLLQNVCCSDSLVERSVIQSNRNALCFSRRFCFNRPGACDQRDGIQFTFFRVATLPTREEELGPWTIASSSRGDKFDSCTMSRSSNDLEVSFIRDQDGLYGNGLIFRPNHYRSGQQ
jgi:hypothetical protein